MGRCQFSQRSFSLQRVTHSLSELIASCRKVSILTSIITFLCLICIIVFTQHIVRGNAYSEYILNALQGPLKPTDSELIKYIRNEILVHPSTRPYNLLGAKNPANGAIEKSERFYRNISQTLFKNKRDGFFIEAGALDGETMSNTLWLEMEKRWTGLLVEADEDAFKAMVAKNRKAWLANACLSPYTFPTQEIFVTQSNYFGPKGNYLGPKVIAYGSKVMAMNSLASYRPQKNWRGGLFVPVQCVPLESLLTALDVRQVDLLSLDIEGAEKDVMKNFPFEKFDIHVIFLEWKLKSTFNIINDILISKGYKLYATSSEDYVYIKKDSPYKDAKYH